LVTTTGFFLWGIAVPLELAVILGSVRQNRIGLRVARFAVAALQKRGHDAALVDPVEFALPLLDKMYKE
jgi:NAD(P)H-dependent FMN reductase